MERELEVKILGYDVDEYIAMIERLGAEFVCEEHQDNYIFTCDSLPDEKYLRLRVVDGEATLTLKERNQNSSYRENIEYSTSVDNAKVLLHIMSELKIDGAKQHKDRIKYKYGDIIFDIDRWDAAVYPEPYMEIEAPSDALLTDIITRLGIPDENISTLSIRELIEKLNK